MLKDKLRLVVLVIGLASCTETATQNTASISTPVSTETFFSTGFSTPIPTSTPAPTKIPTTATATTEPVPFTLFDNVFILGTSGTGENIYGNPYDLFHTFTVQPNEFASFRFIMQITAFHFIKNQLTPTPTALPTEKWRILIYRYETDGVYLNQPAIESIFKTDVIPYKDKLLMHMTADVSMETLQTKFGDSSAFTYQVLNEQEKVQQQGYFSINPHLLFHAGGGLMGNWSDGVTLGFPYSLKEKETEFFHHGKFIIVNEPKSGFYHLIYTFDLDHATGNLYGVPELDAVKDSFTINLFPYREDGNYSNSNSHPLISRLLAIGGLLTVELPIDYMEENTDGKGEYYLQITDSKGIVIKEEYFKFVSYDP